MQLDKYQGNCTLSPEFITDQQIMLRAEATEPRVRERLRKKVNKVHMSENDGWGVPASIIRAVWSKSVTQKAVELVYSRDSISSYGTSTTVWVPRKRELEIHLQAGLIEIVWEATAFDCLRGTGPHDVVVAFVDGSPVGLIMPCTPCAR